MDRKIYNWGCRVDRLRSEDPKLVACIGQTVAILILAALAFLAVML
jgi:hypothetical protein